jgi:hypothetical protein
VQLLKNNDGFTVFKDGLPEIDSRQRQQVFLYSRASKPALGPIEWFMRVLSPVEKRPGREDDHSPPSSAEVDNGRDIPPIPHTPN